MENLVKSGDGWRVGWNPHQSKYKGLVGANAWAIELTQAELKDFCRLLNQLVATMSKMAAELMIEEKISCEAESELLWLEVDGYSDSYSLRLIIHSDRRCEGNWAEGIAPNLVEAINSLGLG